MCVCFAVFTGHWQLRAATKLNHLHPKFIKAKVEEKQGTIMIRVINRIYTDQIVEIGECHLELKLSMDRIIEESHNMLTVLEMTLGEDISEECKIIEVKILEMDIEVTIERKTLEEVEVGLGKDNIRVILEGLIKEVVVDQDQGQELVLIWIGLDVLNVGSMIILLKTDQTQIQKKNSQNKYNKCLIQTKIRQH